MIDTSTRFNFVKKGLAINEHAYGRSHENT